jgi:hypothetical protein
MAEFQFGMIIGGLCVFLGFFLGWVIEKIFI